MSANGTVAWRMRSSVTESASPRGRKDIFVTHFPGDATASQVAALYEQVTAISGSAVPGVDEVVNQQTYPGTINDHEQHVG
jgi:hypothetical protein